MGLPYPPAAERQQALDETIAAMRGLWGAEPFSFDGQTITIRDANVPPPKQQPEPPLCIAGGGRNTLNQVARLADMSNFGPGPAGGTDDVSTAARRLETLKRECTTVGRPYDDILRSHFIHWLILAKNQAAIDAKISRYFADGISEFWTRNLIALTVPAAIDYFQKYVDIGMQYFVCQVLDPLGDAETMELLAREVGPNFVT
jgi:alkanesulfonate monooxygenase SsuD/methylene tetrahydromethanopterin reductase-like flavin-dependent oxidoreductase (luciferase family)